MRGSRGGPKPFASIFAAFGSTTSGEMWTIYGTDTAGKLGSASPPGARTLIASGGGEARPRRPDWPVERSGCAC